MKTPYRTNTHETCEPTTLDRLSFKLVGHYCLFVNVATALTIGIPIWGGMILAGYVLCKCGVK